MPRQAPCQIGEEFLRGRIDPVHVLDDENERPSVARAEEHVAKHAQGPLFQLGSGKAAEEFRRSRHAKKVGEQYGRLAGEQDDGAVAPDSTLIELMKTLDLTIAPHQRGQSALLRYLQPGAAVDLAHQGICPDRLGLTLHLELAQVLENEEPIQEVLGVATYHDLARLRQAE